MAVEPDHKLQAPEVRIELFDAPDALDGVAVADDFGAILGGARLLETMRRNLSGGALIAVALDGRVIRGYATVIDGEPAWRRFAGIPRVVELGAVEVARSARRLGIGGAVLDRLQGHAALDEVITIAYGGSSHWEMDVAGLRPRAYRQMLLKLLARSRFVLQDTDDPDVLEEPLNFLAARFGSNVTAATLLSFIARLHGGGLVEPTPWRT